MKIRLHNQTGGEVPPGPILSFFIYLLIQFHRLRYWAQVELIATRCCFCSRRISTGWLHFLAPASVSHGCCQACYSGEMEKIQQLFATKNEIA